MLVETDREKYAIQRIVDFYERQPTDYADYFQAAWRFKHRAALGKPNATLAAIAADAKVSAKYLPMVWQHPGGTASSRQEVGPIAKLQAMWRALPAPRRRARMRCARSASRCAISSSGSATTRPCSSPRPWCADSAPHSQPLLNWKLPRSSPRTAAISTATRCASRAIRRPWCPTIPQLSRARPGSRRPRGPRSCAKARAGDPDLVVPAGQRDALRGRVRALRLRLPRRLLRQRARPLLPRRFRGQGPPAERRLPQRDGLLPRRYAAHGADPGREGQEGAGPALGRVRLHRRLHRPHLGPVSTSTRAARCRATAANPARCGRRTTTSRAEPIIFGLRDAYLAKAAAEPNNPVALQAIRDHFERVNATLRAMEQHARRSRAAAPGRAAEIRGARLSPAAVAGRARRPPGVLPLAARQGAD